MAVCSLKDYLCNSATLAHNIDSVCLEKLHNW